MYILEHRRISTAKKGEKNIYYPNGKYYPILYNNNIPDA